MILAIDIGNLFLTAGCMDGAKPRYICRLSSILSRTEYEYASILRLVLEGEGINCQALEGAVIASAVPPLTGVIKAAVKLLCGVDALVVSAGLKTGLNIIIDNPAQLGSDLVVGAVAALDAYEPPLLVVDMGTAIAFAVIDGRSRYLGGAIVPGVGLSLEALANGTSQLPKVPIEAPKSCIGTNTVDAIKSGAVFGTAALIDGLAARFEHELGQILHVVATGKVARVIVPYCTRDVTYDEDLLLRGLAIIYEKNKK